jgi:hypothetical protein
MKATRLFIALLITWLAADAQRIGSSPEYINPQTSEWKG